MANEAVTLYLKSITLKPNLPALVSVPFTPQRSSPTIRSLRRPSNTLYREAKTKRNHPCSVARTQRARGEPSTCARSMPPPKKDGGEMEGDETQRTAWSTELTNTDTPNRTMSWGVGGRVGTQPEVQNKWDTMIRTSPPQGCPGRRRVALPGW